MVLEEKRQAAEGAEGTGVPRRFRLDQRTEQIIGAAIEVVADSDRRRRGDSIKWVGERTRVRRRALRFSLKYRTTPIPKNARERKGAANPITPPTRYPSIDKQ